jgi:TetR/AcrR family transcriptional repressor of lmrAB and yxaGH operons
MSRRTDSRSRMIHAAAELFRQRGYHATTFSDVVRESGAPRGSTYFHFPGGKQELAREAIAKAEFSADFDNVFARWRTALVTHFEPLGTAPDRAADILAALDTL